MTFDRASGVLLHPTSLPGRYGIGDLGPEAFRFADWLAGAGQRIWQVLPLGPVGFGESPYQLFSAFAGNPSLISLDALVERGWLDAADVAPPEFAADTVEFERVIPWKEALLWKAFERFHDPELEQFRTEHAVWLPGYSRFMALKAAHSGRMWTEWDAEASPSGGAGASGSDQSHDRKGVIFATEPDPQIVRYHEFLQFEFFREWRALKNYCASRGIRMMGDLPIYVAFDSADVWEHRELFRFDAVAGVPPDYFSATGQLWGNPLYRWDCIKAEGYRWWIERMVAALSMFDLVRMDHFRGFEAYWAVPAGETTAINGQWIKGPGADLFRALKDAIGELPIVAENLGVITPEVEAIRNEFGLPGMSILQFAFGTDEQARSFRPHNYVRNLAAYTGTHDNDTAAGWWRSDGGDSTLNPEDVAAEKARARKYLDTDGREMNWTLIRALMASVANTVLFPAQDILGLGSEARMNTPAVASGNWRWRMRPGALTPELAARLQELTKLYER